ncbi:dimethylarginine dimethylaminohydrolase family protein [Nocardioides limicola]|uniref:dimethylarginine dimethylaminohydrolase family protein n=1 Tax=Nocardioides limicola TaxID=2803368 RepID=UPI00193B0775|nr:arginine deiminase-related protein [Nocardioides sp. DJM-14]
MYDALAWGGRYLMVSPDHYRIDYAINPYMDPARQPDPSRARDQWQQLKETIERLGGQVEVLPQVAEAPDMVFAMNLGLPLVDPDGSRRIVLSHMRHPQRRIETPEAEARLVADGWTATRLGSDGLGPHFEAGDAFCWRGDLVVGHGPRTEASALQPLAEEVGARVLGVRLTRPGMYHLDLAFCPLDEARAMIFPGAFAPASAHLLEQLVPEPLLLSEDEAATFCANSIVVGRTVVMPACPDRVRAQLEEWGFDVVLVDVSEFHLAGGSVRCLTNPLDVTVGRDLAPLPGGRLAA